MKKAFGFIATMILAMTLSVGASAKVNTIITFDNAVAGPAQDGFDGLGWSGLDIVTGSLTKTGYNASAGGFVGTFSDSFTITNPNLFDFNSFSMVAASGVGDVTVMGYDKNGVPATEIDFFLPAGAVHNYFTYLGNLGSVTFFSNNGTQLYVDNINITSVPEPETYVMVLAGLMVMSYVVKRKNTNAKTV